MIWLGHKADQIHPVLNSLRNTRAHRQRTEIQQNLHQNQTNWRIVGSVISLIIFMILLSATVIGLPVILTRVKHEPMCLTTNWITFSTSTFQSNTIDTFIPENSMQLCTANASWNPRGVTVAGLANGLPTTSLAGLQYPYDIYVYDNGTILVADSGNNRVTKWDPGATQGMLVAGTSSYGSWNNLLAKPMALTVRNKQMYVSDLDNYRIQVFPLDSNLTSPDAITILGRYGQGADINQINQITSIVAPTRFPTLLYMTDMLNHRILLWDIEKNISKVVVGESNVFGSDSIHLFNPSGITLNERTNTLYIADKSNNRIQKYNIDAHQSSITVAGWGQLKNPHAVQLDPSGMNMFIADTLNHRILLWLNDAVQGRIIAGDGSAGTSPYQLNSPTQIRFDSNSNLYVVDTNNCRIQRFDLISNGC